MNQLTPRQAFILQSVIESHIQSSQPVSSKWVKEAHRLSSSTATVRNEMGALEDMGYLRHVHTSSGRVPTDTGYRYYVNYQIEESSNQDQDEWFYDLMRSKTEEFSGRLENVLEQTIHWLASLTEEISLVVQSDSDFELSEQPQRLKWLFQGITYLLEKPEFQDIRKARGIFQTLEEKERLKERLSKAGDEHSVQVTIGREHEEESLHECSLVSTHFYKQGRRSGTIAVLGPKRMQYQKAIPLVKRTALFLDTLLGSGEWQ